MFFDLIESGTILSMGTIFVFVYGLTLGGKTSYHAVDAMALSILLSATDPVATLSVYSKLMAHPIPHIICFGESILNDGVSIVIFRAVYEFYAVDDLTVGKVILNFVVFIIHSLHRYSKFVVS